MMVNIFSNLLLSLVINASVNFTSFLLFSDEPQRDAMDKIVYLPEANKRSETNELLGDMREDTRVLLYQFYQPFNSELAMLLEDDKFNYGLR